MLYQNDLFWHRQVVYPPSQKASSGRAGMNAKRVSTVAMAKVNLLRQIPLKM